MEITIFAKSKGELIFEGGVISSEYGTTRAVYIEDCVQWLSATSSSNQSLSLILGDCQLFFFFFFSSVERVCIYSIASSQALTSMESCMEAWDTRLTTKIVKCNKTLHLSKYIAMYRLQNADLKLSNLC